jgi:hypothetical protein
MKVKCRHLAATAVVLGILGLPQIGLAQDELPICGSAEVGRTSLVTTPVENVIDLGRARDGERSWDVVFVWDATCSLEDVTVRLRDLQGTNSSIEADGIKITEEIGEQRLIVTLAVPRQEVPAGKYTGTLEVTGPGIAGIGSTLITLRHQEPVAMNTMSGPEQFWWLVIALAVCAALITALAITKRTNPYRSMLYAPLVFAALVALYPVAGRLRGEEVPALWWPIWLGVVGLVGGFLVGALKYTAGGAQLQGGVRFGAAMTLSFGAGLAVWRSQYLNTPDWALSLETAFGLIAVVGAATLTSTLLLLQSPTPAPNGGHEADPPGTGQSDTSSPAATG